MTHKSASAVTLLAALLAGCATPPERVRTVRVDVPVPGEWRGLVWYLARWYVPGIERRARRVALARDDERAVGRGLCGRITPRLRRPQKRRTRLGRTEN